MTRSLSVLLAALWCACSGPETLDEVTIAGEEQEILCDECGGGGDPGGGGPGGGTTTPPFAGCAVEGGLCAAGIAGSIAACAGCAGVVLCAACAGGAFATAVQCNTFRGRCIDGKLVE